MTAATGDNARPSNAQELTLQAMASEVELIMSGEATPINERLRTKQCGRSSRGLENATRYCLEQGYGFIVTGLLAMGGLIALVGVGTWVAGGPA